MKFDYPGNQWLLSAINSTSWFIGAQFSTSCYDPYGIQATLGSQLSHGASISFPGSEAFARAGSRWTSGNIHPSFFASVAVATEKDIQLAVQFANANNIPFLATSGGHGIWRGLNAVTNGLQIYMRGLNSSVINKDKNTATFGGGILGYEVDAALFAEGKYAVTGLCPCVSLMGPALGGGHGLLQGRYGLMADNIVSANVVLANGTAITTNKTSHPDLYWGIKGAGHNFGIVTSVEYNVYDIEESSTWTVTIYYYTQEKLEQVLSIVNSYILDPNRPVELLIWVMLSRNDEIDPNNPVIVLTVKYDGTAEQAMKYKAPFEELRPKITTDDVVTKYNDVVPTMGYPPGNFPCDRSYDIELGGISLIRYNIERVRQVYELLARTSAIKGLERSFILLESYPNNKVREISVNSTAVSPEERRANILVGGILVFARGDTESARIAFEVQRKIRELFVAGVDMEQDGRMGNYVNYANGEQSPQELYGYEAWRVERLRDLSARYDPERKFRFYASF